MKKILILISLLVFSLSWILANNINLLISQAENKTINSYSLLNQEEKDLFLNFRIQFIRALWKINDTELLNYFYVQLNDANSKRNFWNLEQSMIDFSIEWIVKRINFLWWEVSYFINNDVIKSNTFYQDMYDNRLKEFDDIILSLQRNVIKDFSKVMEIIESDFDFYSFINHPISKQEMTALFDLELIWDFSLNLSYLLEIVQNIDNKNWLLDWNYIIDFTLDGDLFDNKISINNDINIKKDKSNLYFLFNKLDMTWLNQFLSKEDNDYYDFIVNYIQSYKWNYIKIASNELDYIFDDLIINYTDWFKSVTNNYNNFYHYLNNYPLFSVYEKSWENEYKLFYNENFVDLIYSIDNDINHRNDLINNFETDYKLDVLKIYDLWNWKYSLYNKDEFFNEEITIIFSKNWFENISVITNEFKLYYENKIISIFSDYLDLEILFNEIYSSNPNITIKWYSDYNDIKSSFSINFSKTSWINFSVNIDYQSITFLIDWLISNNKVSLSLDIDNIGSDINNMIWFIFWINPGIKSISLNMLYELHNHKLDDLIIEFPTNFILLEDLFDEIDDELMKIFY